MGMFSLIGGRTNKKAEVDANGFLETKSFTQSFELRHAVLGYTWNLNTGDITANNTAHGVSYLKNTGDNTLIITAFIYLLGNPTGSSNENGRVTVIESPTGGTLLSSGTTGTAKNRAVGNKRPINATWLIGASDGTSTVTGGTTLLDTLLATPKGRISVPVFVTLSKEQSVAIKYTPPASNTSQVNQFAFAVYEDKLGGD